MTDIDHQLAAAEYFLEPILRRESILKASGSSIVERLSTRLDHQDGSDEPARNQVVTKALSLLESIHDALSLAQDRARASELISISTNRRLIDALLDLVSLEGIYPCLLLGVGVPIEGRVKSIIENGAISSALKAADARDSNSGHLLSIARRLSKLAMGEAEGIAHLVRERSLIDVIAALAQETYAPRSYSAPSPSAKLDLETLVAGIPAAALFPCFVSLLHSATPSWLRSPISSILSLLPMRDDGVRQTIFFIMKSSAEAQSGDNDKQNNAVLALENLKQLSQVLSSIPKLVSAEDWFASISPQLLEILDDSDTDLQRAAAFVINQGILNRRSTGLPGTAGWKYLAEPIIQVIKPSFEDKGETGMGPIVASKDFSRALQRLSTIVLSHPNPGLSKRLLTPFLLPLWGIGCVGRKRSEESEKASALLQSHISQAGGSTVLIKVLDNLCWDGEPGWQYRSSQAGGIEVVPRSNDGEQINTMNVLLKVVPRRVQLYLGLLDHTTDDQELVDILLHLLRGWLKEEQQDKYTEIGGRQENTFLRSYITTQVAQQLILAHGPRITSTPTRTLEVVQELLAQYLQKDRRKLNKKDLKLPLLASIGPIASDTRSSDNSDVEEESDVLSISLGLLDILVQESQRTSSPELQYALKNTRPTLITLSHSRSLSHSARSEVQSLLSQLPSSVGPPTAPEPVDSSSNATNLHRKALNNIAAPEPPIRAQGIAQLESLIKANSPTISAPATAVTLLSLIQDNDSFVYLSAVRALTSLARANPSSVVTQLTEAYQDPLAQSSLDVRLRIGEAIQSVVEQIGPDNLPQPAADRLSRILLQMAASRRSHRGQGGLHRTQESEQDTTPIAIQNSIDLDLDPDSDSDSDSDTEALRSRLRTASILEGWRGKQGEEDVRVRASALSILGTMIEHSHPSSTSTSTGVSAAYAVIPQAVDLASTILARELSAEKAILRRAAVLVFAAVLGTAEENSGAGAGGLALVVLGPGKGNTTENAGAKRDDALELLQRVRDGDEDDIVRGHAERVLERMQTLREEEMRRLVAGEGIRFGLEEGTKLSGIDVDVRLHTKENARPKPKIEEIE